MTYQSNRALIQVVIVGTTGSGKSSVLQAALRLMRAPFATTHVRGRVAYVPQAAFIFDATVRDNILLYQPYDAVRYSAAIAAAQLLPDLAGFPEGDNTLLGERGTNLSGGQRQRVSLARALYADAQVYLLDDPLSALDAEVGRKVFKQAILRDLLGDRGCTVVLVSNLLQYAKYANTVVFMKDGVLSEVGSYMDLVRRGGGFAQLTSELSGDGSLTSRSSVSG